MSGSLVLVEGEREVMRSSAKLLERQVTSHFSASTGGVSVRPIRGLTLRLGGWSGDRAAVEHELAPVDAGDLVKTDRRLVPGLRLDPTGIPQADSAGRPRGCRGCRSTPAVRRCLP